MMRVVVEASLLDEVHVRLNGTVNPGIPIVKSVSDRLMMPWYRSGVAPVSRSCEKSDESVIPLFETTPPFRSRPSSLDNMSDSMIGYCSETVPVVFVEYRSCSQANPVHPLKDCIVDATVTMPPAFSCC